MSIRNVLVFLLAFFSLSIAMFIASCHNYPGEKHIEPSPFLKQSMAKVLESIPYNSNAQTIYLLDSLVGNPDELAYEDKIFFYKAKTNFYNTHTDNFDSSLRYANMVISLIEQVGATKYKADYVAAYYQLGDAYYKKGSYKKAYEYFIKASSMGELGTDSCSKGEYAYRIAMVLYKQTNYDDAAAYFKDAFSYYNACKFSRLNFSHTQAVLDNIGLSYANNNNLDSAIRYYNLALDYINDTSLTNKLNLTPNHKYLEICRAVVYGNLGSVYMVQGRNEDAKKLFHRSININAHGGDLKDAQATRLKLASLFVKEKQYDSLRMVLTEVKNAPDAYPADNFSIEINRLWWLYYERTGDTMNAYRYLRDFTMAYEDYRKNDLNRRDENLSQQMKLVAKQNNIDLLMHDNKFSRIYLKAALLIVVFVVLLFILIYSNWVKSRKSLATQTKLTREVFKQKKKLEDLNNEKDRIMQIVAHDLRSPVSAVFMFSDMLKEEADEDNRQEMIQLIKTASENALTLISEMLESPFSNRDKLVMELGDLNELVKSTVELLKFRALEKGQTIVETLTDEPVMVQFNKDKMRRVVSNLIINAIKFSPQGAGIEVGLLVENGFARIVIKDHGIGIPDKLKPQIFEMFTDARRPGTNGERPFGLGLSICKFIVDAHGGKIWFDSKPDQGSTFYVALKVEKESAASAN